MTTEITYESAKASLERAVASKPEGFTYSEARREKDGDLCVYFEDDGLPSCIVGCVLADHGYTPADLVLNGVDRNADTNITEVRRLGIVKLDRSTEALLKRAQNRQDRGDTWAVAVSAAFKRVSW